MTSLNPWRGLGSLPREMWILSATTLVNRMGTMALPFLVLYLTRSMHYSPQEAGSVLAVYGIAALVSAPLAGLLADRAGSVRVMLSSLFLTGGVLLVIPFAAHPAALLPAVVAWAVISESFRPANLSIITELVEPEQRRTAFALNRLAINLGMSVGPALGGILVLISYDAIFWVNSAVTVIAAAILAGGAGSLKRKLAQKKSDAAAARAGTMPRLSSVSALHDRRLLYFLLAILPVFVIFFQHNSTFPLFLVRDLGLHESAFGFLFSVNTLLITVVEVPLNIATAHIPHRRMLTIGAFLVGLGFGAMALATGFWSVAATVVIWTFGEMILLPTSVTYMSELAPSDRRGEYMGAYQMVFSLAIAASALAGTAVLEHFGAVVLWTGVFVAGCVSAGLMMGIDRKELKE